MANMVTSRASERRILVVDDSVVVRRIVEMTVRQIPSLMKATVDEAADGETALEMLRHHGYDLVLTDIRMPGLDGLGLVRRIRAELGDDRTPIILVSTLGSEDDVRRGLEAGATAYVPKPVSPHRIRAVIGKLLRIRT
jgi:CheY-like chemotaxis protein